MQLSQCFLSPSHTSGPALRHKGMEKLARCTEGLVEAEMKDSRLAQLHRLHPAPAAPWNEQLPCTLNTGRMYIAGATGCTVLKSGGILLRVLEQEPCCRSGELLWRAVHAESCKIKFTRLVKLLKPALPQKIKDCPLWQF